MISIKLISRGRKKRRHYDIVVQDGYHLPKAKLGWYDPQHKAGFGLKKALSKVSKIDLETYDKWIKFGAQPSSKVHEIYIAHVADFVS